MVLNISRSSVFSVVTASLGGRWYSVIAGRILWSNTTYPLVVNATQPCQQTKATRSLNMFTPEEQLTGCSFCCFAAKAAKYGPLQGFLGGAGGGGVYRGKTLRHILLKTSQFDHTPYVNSSEKSYPLFWWSLLQVELQDARANTVEGGSRRSLEIQCDLKKPWCYCMI